MTLTFKSNPKPTLGVEVEVQLIDKSSKDLKAGALEILRDAAGNPDVHVKAELTQAMVEINTGVCETVSQVGKDIKKQMQFLSSIAAKRGLELAVAGSHPFQSWWERTIFPAERYRKILEKFQWLSR